MVKFKLGFCRLFDINHDWFLSLAATVDKTRTKNHTFAKNNDLILINIENDNQRIIGRFSFMFTSFPFSK